MLQSTYKTVCKFDMLTLCIFRKLKLYNKPGFISVEGN